MALLQKLKSLFGVADGDAERGHDRDVGITVERERDGPDDAESDGGAGASAAESSTGTPAPPPESPTAETAASSAEKDETMTPSTAEKDEATTPSTAEGDETMTSTAEGDEATAEAASTAEATPSGSSRAAREDATTGAGESGRDGTAEPDVEEAESDPVDSIKGIGPAYAERLSEAGVETVDDLAAADAEDLESETDISATRIRGWIERAKVR